jgi:hypothetical protein
MGVRIEWRTRGERDDAILVVDEADNTVRQGLAADPEVLRDFLNNMADLDRWRSLHPVGHDRHESGAWGELVMARAPTGEVITMDPERFWEGIYVWFRSRGVDPHSRHP